MLPQLTRVPIQLTRSSFVNQVGLIRTTASALPLPVQVAATARRHLSALPEPPRPAPPPAAARLTTEFWTIPNALTLSRIAASPLLAHLIVTDQARAAFFLACAAAATDFLECVTQVLTMCTAT